MNCMQIVAPFYPKCAISQAMRSRGGSVLQYNAKQDHNFEDNFFDILEVRCFCNKGMAISQIKSGFFLVFKQLVWRFSGLFFALFDFLLKLSSGNPAVWHRALTCKLMQLLPGRHMVSLIMEMVGNCKLTLITSNNKSSRLQCLKNSVLQGSVLASLHFSIYLSDLPTTDSRKYA